MYTNDDDIELTTYVKDVINAGSTYSTALVRTYIRDLADQNHRTSWKQFNAIVLPHVQGLSPDGNIRYRTCLLEDSNPQEKIYQPRILSLDGGGVRCLSSLLVLREIMEDIGRQTGANETPLPCDYFDLIGGTSWGGLSAIMLGRLRMVSFHS